MRDGAQGLTLRLHHKQVSERKKSSFRQPANGMQMNLKSLRNREISERRQVGDAEAMINQQVSSGHDGLFRGSGGEV